MLYDPMGKKGGEDEGEKEREGGRGYSMSNFSCWREPLTNGAADKVSFFFLSCSTLLYSLFFFVGDRERRENKQIVS